MCSLPGCVAQAIAGALCPVHAAGGGKVCDRCHGEGKCFYSGHNETMTCPQCGGTGLADKKAAAPRVTKGADPVDGRGLIGLSEGE